MRELLDYTIQLAKQAGGILLDSYDNRGFTARKKPDKTLVTDADLAVDEHLFTSLAREFPDDLILSEERDTVIQDPNRNTWVIDPLDGTTNFSLGLHLWGISIARIVNGLPQLAVLHYPAISELYSAASGLGAYLNGEQLSTRSQNHDQPISFFTCCSLTIKHYTVRIPYKIRILGSATYDFCATSRCAALIGFHAKSKLWDIAAGWFLLEQAGGAVEIYTGKNPFPLTEGSDYREQDFTVLMAASSEILVWGRERINPK